MRIYRRSYADRSGSQQESKRWQLEWRHDGRLCRLAGFPSKAATRELARQIEALQSLAAVRARPDPELARFLETLPSAMRARLVSYGLIAGSNAAASRPLTDHIADFDGALRARGNTGDYASLTAGRVRRIVDACAFKFWSDLSASKAEQAIADLREDTIVDGTIIKRGLSAQSANYYAGALKQFGRWMIRDGRAVESPFDALRMLNARTDRRHQRRALPVEDLRALIDAAERGEDYMGVTGHERAILYRVAVETGLRANELRSLTRASFDLHADMPTVTVQAAYSKRRREDTLPMRSELAETLRAFMGSKAPAAQAFNMPSPNKLAPMMRADLSAAGIAYRDDAGRVFDFHALRGQFVTMLAANGIHPKTAQTLARHSTITLTMDRYTHTLRGAEADALDALPDLSGHTTDTVRATGTGDRTPLTIPENVARAGARATADVRVYSPEHDGHNTHDVCAAQNAATAGETLVPSSESKRPRSDSNRRNNGFAIRPLRPLGYAAGPPANPGEQVIMPGIGPNVQRDIHFERSIDLSRSSMGPGRSGSTRVDSTTDGATLVDPASRNGRLAHHGLRGRAVW